MPFSVQKSMNPVVKGAADVVFVIDSTMSMQSIIDGVKQNVQSFVEGLQADPQTSLDWKVWVVGYRDVEADGLSNAFVNLEKGFVDTVEEVVDQLGQLRADGGGDEPESLLDVLYKIARAEKWPRSDKESQRVIAVFTDAPPIEEMSELVATGDRSVHTVVKELSKQHVKIYIYGPSDNEVLRTLTGMHTKSMYFELGNTYDEVIESLEKQGFDDVLKQMGATLSSAGKISVVDAESRGSKGVL
jgi:uncharacterized protein YegL